MDRYNDDGSLTHDAKQAEAALQATYRLYRGTDDEYCHAGAEAVENWLDMKYGIRIHWGLYSLPGNFAESWGLRDSKNPVMREQYESMSQWWNPTGFDAKEWTQLFADGGMTFFTFTTKHLDGFSMFDTKTKVRKRRVHTGPEAGSIADCDLHYSIAEGPFGRDVVGELVAAGRAQGLKVGLYFSHIDWFDADFRCDEWNYQRDETYTRESDPEGYARLIRRHREQLRELCTNYGKIDHLSLDMGLPGSTPELMEQLKELKILTQCLGFDNGLREELIQTVKMIRRLQPQVMMRRRGIDPYGDYFTPERAIPEDDQSQKLMPWKVIYPGGKHFSFQWDDDYKPASWIIENLIDVVAKGGNMQIGYGPGPDGRWPTETARRIRDVGNWLKTYGEGIYATRPYTPYKEGDGIRFTRTKDNRVVYAFVTDWVEGASELVLTSVRASQGAPITVPGLDHEFEYSQDAGALRIQIPAWFDPAKGHPESRAFAFRIPQA
jgi:alpha-L-fucosidase